MKMREHVISSYFINKPYKRIPCIISYNSGTIDQNNAFYNNNIYIFYNIGSAIGNFILYKYDLNMEKYERIHEYTDPAIASIQHNNVSINQKTGDFFYLRNSTNFDNEHLNILYKGSLNNPSIVYNTGISLKTFWPTNCFDDSYNYLYFFGGRKTATNGMHYDNLSNYVYKYNIAENSIEEYEFEERFCWSKIFFYDGDLYMVGNVTSSFFNIDIKKSGNDGIYKINFATPKLEYYASIPERIYTPGIVYKYNDLIYILSYISINPKYDKTPGASGLVFNMKTKKTLYTTRMPYSCVNHALKYAAFDNHIYVFNMHDNNVGKFSLDYDILKDTNIFKPVLSNIITDGKIYINENNSVSNDNTFSILL